MAAVVACAARGTLSPCRRRPDTAKAATQRSFETFDMLAIMLCAARMSMTLRAGPRPPTLAFSSPYDVLEFQSSRDVCREKTGLGRFFVASRTARRCSFVRTRRNLRIDEAKRLAAPANQLASPTVVHKRPLSLFRHSLSVTNKS